MGQHVTLPGLGVYVSSICGSTTHASQLLVMQSLPDRTAEDDKAIDVLLQGIKGEGERQRQRGTFLTYLAAMRNNENDGMLRACGIPCKS